MAGFTVLNFHGIGRPERPLEAGEAAYWVSIEQFTRILDQVAGHPRRERIRITFDDSNRSDRRVALPMLLARGLGADFFVLTGRIGQRGSLDAEDIRALQAAGMGIGSHGIAHRDWSRLPPDELEVELRQSKDDLEKICGRQITSAGIPFGLYNRAVLRALRSAGYEVVYSSDRGTSRDGDFPRPRTSVRGDWPPAALPGVLAGEMPPVQRLRRFLGMARKRWLA